MGRRKKQWNTDLTVKIVRGENEAVTDRWYRAMALLLSPKFDDPEPTENTSAPHSANAGQVPLSEEQIMSARLDMACGLTA